MTAINQELYEALIAAGAPDDIAKRAAASVLSRDDLNQLAMKGDLRELRLELQVDMAEIKVDLIKWMAGLVIGAVVAMTGIFAAILRLMLPNA